MEKTSFLNAKVSFERFGAPHEVLQLVECEETTSSLELGENVLIKVEASTVTLEDCLARRNIRQNVKLPHTTGCDVIGEVILCGEKAYKYGSIQEGDRVATIGKRLGGNSLYVIVPSYHLMPVPKSIKADELVCLLRTYMTAYQCLHRIGNVRKGDKILILGESTGITNAVVQLAKNSGIHNVYTTYNSNYEYICAKDTFQLSEMPSEWLPHVEGKMDLVIDAVSSDNYACSRRAIKSETGKLICISSNLNDIYGDVGCDMKALLSGMLMQQTWRYDPFESMNQRPDEFREDLKILVKLLGLNKIKPQIDDSVNLNNVAIAHKMVELGAGGSIVCIPDNVYKKAPRPRSMAVTTKFEQRDDHLYNSGSMNTNGIPRQIIIFKDADASIYREDITEVVEETKQNGDNKNAHQLTSETSNKKLLVISEKQQLRSINEEKVDKASHGAGSNSLAEKFNNTKDSRQKKSSKSSSKKEQKKAMARMWLNWKAERSGRVLNWAGSSMSVSGCSKSTENKSNASSISKYIVKWTEGNEHFSK